MEQKHIVLSALSVGVGVGVGIGLASGKTVSKWRGDASDGINSETMEQELLRQVIDGRDSGVTFDQFPYYLRSLFLSLVFYLFKYQYFVIALANTEIWLNMYGTTELLKILLNHHRTLMTLICMY
jgi:hypothetical protein